ncbi:MAG: hypothetical protein HY553_04040 [Elusimicrobia bacterium]|nr:hypothetical protein [Elusimicrobiota bacterium]
MRRLLALILVASASPAWARSPYYPRAIPVSMDAAEDKKWELQIRPGFAIPRGALADIAKHSATVHVSVERRLNDTLSLGLDVGQNIGHRYEGRHGQNGSFTSDIQIGIFQITPTFKLGFDIPVGYHSLRPYFVAAAGLYLENRNAGTVTLLPSNVQRRVDAARARGFGGINGGVGLVYRPSVRVRLGVETRYHYYAHDDDLDGSGTAQDSVRYLTTAGVVSWLF